MLETPDLRKAARGCTTLKHFETAYSAYGSRDKLRELYRDVHGKGKRPYRDRVKRGISAPGWDTAPLGPWTGGITPVDPAPAPEKPIAGGVVTAPDEQRPTLTGRRFVFTSAQNNTHVHPDFWSALQTFCRYNDATLHVSRFTYNKNGWNNHGGVSKDQPDEDDDIWYDPVVRPFLLDRQVKVADGLLFCGELDILPTAALPLNTLQNYTGHNSGIVPHAKVHMQSFATMKHEAAKFMYSTGTCTLRNYIERKAGQVATFHHTFGALYVEIDEDGDWFVRQLLADDNGVFFDIASAYGPGWVTDADTFGDTLVTLGDIHIEQIDHAALEGALSMCRATRPSDVFVHDLIDFQPRNHHNVADPFFRAAQHFHGINVVEQGMLAGARFLSGLRTNFPDTTVNVVRSNHDQAFERWLRDDKALLDPANARYWHEANCALLRSIEEGAPADIFVWAMRRTGCDMTGVRFIAEDESVVMNGIEHGMHGHRGPNGARGNPKAFRQLGRKTNTAHTHSAGIIDGVWTAGLLAKLDMGYNVGPSSWSHSNIITYPSGKRAIITQRGRKWRA